MRLVFIIALLNIFLTSWSQILFEDYFEKRTLRLDYFQGGNKDTSVFYFDKFKKEPFWGGSLINLIDTFRYGELLFEVYDSATNTMIYSRGYASLFNEWQTTAEAKIRKEVYPESIIMPFPQKPVSIKIYKRNKKQIFHEVFDIGLNPSNYFISKGKLPGYEIEKIHNSGSSETNIDIVIIPEGYTESDLVKFKADAQRFKDTFFEWSPFDTYKNKFNFWLVLAPSEDTGCDIPRDYIWKNTLLNSSFYTFDSERYLTTKSYHKVRDVAACAPYDQIIILVNTPKYGGGGIYNFYSICASDNPRSEFVFMHEFGHAFASLADEYYSSQVSYEDYFDLTVEPYQPNITTLVDFDKKWKDLVESGVPIPTPNLPEYKDKVGVFEGGGYVAKGIYRPTVNSSMKSSVINEFGPVNERAIIHIIKFYSQEPEVIP